jgi:hypothetical protein
MGDYFFNPEGSRFDAQRALIIMHESVHQFGLKRDKDFNDNLTGIIVDQCIPILKTIKALGALKL